MAAGGWFDWSTGDLVTEARFQDIQDSLVFIFASESAANSALTNKVEGTIFYDTGADLLKAWNGSSWITAESGDIEGITTSSTSGLDGGATSGTPSLSVKPNSATSGTVAAGDEILFGDINDSNNLKKTTAQDIANLAPAGGLTEIDSFTITSNVTGNGDLTSNWQRSTASGFAKLGTGMAETGGIFTFPSTGFYEVEAIIFFESRSAAFPQIQIQVTTDNSSYSTALTIFGGERANQGGTGVTHSGTTFVDVTDTTQVKVKFTSANLDSSNIIDASNTIFNFKKLGDT